MEREFKRDIESLEQVFEFLHRFMHEHQVGSKTTHDMDLVVEELFTNMVKYNAGAREDIVIRIQKSSNVLSIVLTDPNSERFDITKVVGAPLDLPLRQREPGGLGIHLVQRLTDSFQYEHAEGASTITVTKRLE